MLPELEIRGVRRISKQADLKNNLSAARYTLSRLFRMLACSSLESPHSIDRYLQPLLDSWWTSYPTSGCSTWEPVVTGKKRVTRLILATDRKERRKQAQLSLCLLGTNISRNALRLYFCTSVISNSKITRNRYFLIVIIVRVSILFVLFSFYLYYITNIYTIIFCTINAIPFILYLYLYFILYLYYPILSILYYKYRG